MLSDSIKAIVVDLDRTLLHFDKTLSAYSLNVLKKCKKIGMKIVVATARPFRTTVQYCTQIDFDAIVVSNGARVIFGDKQKNHAISIATAERLLMALQCKPNLRITLETGDCAYSNAPVAEYETVLSSDLAGIANAEGALKILVHLDNDAILHFVQNELSDDLYYTIANGYLMQIMDRSATKGNGIKTMLDDFGISPNETVYFGDDHDDIESIRICGMGVAVSNGIEEVKAVADHIVDSNDEDGVARFIEHVLL